MIGPENLRVYGLLFRNGKILISAETVAGRDILKFPGGGVECEETPEEALVREFKEECQILIKPLKLLNSPGTLFSPWTHSLYTPLYYRVVGKGNPKSPAHEDIELTFFSPTDAIASKRMAEPEILALQRALA